MGFLSCKLISRRPSTQSSCDSDPNNTLQLPSKHRRRYLTEVLMPASLDLALFTAPGAAFALEAQARRVPACPRRSACSATTHDIQSDAQLVREATAPLAPGGAEGVLSR